MHAVYTTKGWVLRNQISGEANATLLLYTEGFGLIRVHAQGLRRSTSKLAPHCTLLSFGNFSLVKGKEVWRLIGAEKVFINSDSSVRQLLARIAKLIERLIQGEEKSSGIYHIIENLAAFYHKDAGQDLVSPDRLIDGEILANLRLLYELGYLADNAEVREQIADYVVERAHLEAVLARRKDLLITVNKSLRESQM